MFCIVLDSSGLLGIRSDENIEKKIHLARYQILKNSSKIKFILIGMLFASRRVQNMETYVFGLIRRKQNLLTKSTVLNTCQKKPDVMLGLLCAMTINKFHAVTLTLLIRYVFRSPPH